MLPSDDQGPMMKPILKDLIRLLALCAEGYYGIDAGYLGAEPFVFLVGQ